MRTVPLPRLWQALADDDAATIAAVDGLAALYEIVGDRTTETVSVIYARAARKLAFEEIGANARTLYRRAIDDIQRRGMAARLNLVELAAALPWADLEPNYGVTAQGLAAAHGVTVANITHAIERRLRRSWRTRFASNRDDLASLAADKLLSDYRCGKLPDRSIEYQVACVVKGIALRQARLRKPRFVSDSEATPSAESQVAARELLDQVLKRLKAEKDGVLVYLKRVEGLSDKEIRRALTDLASGGQSEHARTAAAWLGGRTYDLRDAATLRQRELRLRKRLIAETDSAMVVLGLLPNSLRWLGDADAPRPPPPTGATQRWWWITAATAVTIGGVAALMWNLGQLAAHSSIAATAPVVVTSPVVVTATLAQRASPPPRERSALAIVEPPPEPTPEPTTTPTSARFTRGPVLTSCFSKDEADPLAGRLSRTELAVMLLEYRGVETDELTAIHERVKARTWGWADFPAPHPAELSRAILAERNTPSCGDVTAIAVHLAGLRGFFAGDDGGCFGKKAECKFADRPAVAAEFATVVCRLFFWNSGDRCMAPAPAADALLQTAGWHGQWYAAPAGRLLLESNADESARVRDWFLSYTPAASLTRGQAAELVAPVLGDLSLLEGRLD